MQSINENTVLTLIKQANGTGTGIDNASRRAAAEQLMQIKNTSGYPSALLKIWQSSQPDNLRLIALSQFKNQATDNFRHTKNSQEKEHCKNLLITTYLKEKSEKVTKMIAQCIAKLARKEWPQSWDQLFQVLVTNIKQDDANTVLKTSIVIRDVLQEMNGMRLPIHQPAIHKLSTSLMPILYQIWQKAFQFSFQQFESQQNCDLIKLHQCLKLAALLCQSIRVLIKKASSIDFTNNSVGGQYLTKSLDVIQKLHDRYYVQLASHQDRNKSPLKDILDCMGGILKTLLSTVRDAHDKFTLQFRLILPNFLSYYTHLIIKHRKNRQRNLNEPYLNEVIVYGLLFLNDVCRHQQYDGKAISGIQFNQLSGINGRGKVEFNKQDAEECKLIVTQFFNKDRLTNIIQCLVSDLFILTRKDLEERALEPCEKWKERHIEHSDDNIRAAAKQLFKSLTKKYLDIVAPVIIEMFKSVTTNNGQQNINLNQLNFKQMDPENDIYKPFFLKEAVYLAFGLKYFDIVPYLNQHGVNFANIGKILSNDLKLYGSTNGYKIPFLSSRIIWLFGELRDDINRDNSTKQFVYNAILSHLEPMTGNNNDLSLENELLLLRLVSAEALHQLLDDTQFEANQYEHLLQRTFGLLLKLVQDCDASLDCMQDVLRYIGICIKQNAATLSGEGKRRSQNNNNQNQNQSQIDHAQIVNSIFQSMGDVWDSCDSTETNLCRVNLIRCITHLVGCMKSINVHKLYPKLIPMISYCTESTEDDNKIILIEQGLELWHKVLYHSYELKSEMDQLFSRNWIPQMKTNQDFFEILAQILKSYLFLGGGNFVQNHAQDINQTLAAVVPDITDMDDEFEKITDVLCVFVQLFPNQSPEFLFSIIEHLTQNFLQTMNKENNLNNSNNNNIQGNAINHNEMFMPTYITTKRIECYLLFFCRLILVNCDGTLKVLKSIEQKQNNNNIMKLLFQSMFSCKERVKQFYKQKIVALGLLRIFQGVTQSDTSLILPLLSQSLGWFLSVIKDTEIESLEFADDILPEIDESNKTEWTEADRVSLLYCKDMVSHTFMIQVLQKVLIDSCKKLNVSSMENFITQIAQNQSQGSKNDMNGSKGNIIEDTKYCIEKYDEYLKNKENEDEDDD